MTKQDKLTMTKAKLGITDDSKDALIGIYLDGAAEKVRAYINRRVIPKPLDFTVTSIAADMFNLNSPLGEKDVTEERQGNRTVKYKGSDDYDAIVGSYAAELNRYRRISAR
jgi:hypothetical protein